MLPCARLRHEIEGRLRLSVPEKRGDADYFSHLQQSLSAASGVDTVSVNLKAASVLIHHACSSADIFAYAHDQSLFELQDFEDTDVDSYSQIQDNLRAFDERLSELTDGALDARGAAFSTLMAIGVIEAIKGNVAAPAVSMFWYAMAALLLIQGKPGPA